MNDAEYLIAERSGRIFIKIVGNARYTNSAEFGNFVLNDLLKKSHSEEVLLDLSETKFMDSTVMGLIARLAGYSISKFQAKLKVKSQNKVINDLLYNTGFNDYILIIDDIDEQNYKGLNCSDNHDNSLEKLILEAHKALSEMNEINRKEFKTVIEMLSKSQED